MKAFKLFHGIPKIYLLATALLCVKLTLLPFSQTINADAVSRIFESLKWAQNPSWTTSSVWAPFHFYIHGTALMLWGNIIYTPKLLTILFSVITLFPFYYLVKREFNESGAFIAAIILAICPILFHNSFLALSETPYLFFLSIFLNTLSKGVKENSSLYFLLAGLFLSVAAGIRYEAWIITTIFGFLLLISKQWKGMLLFGFTASLFPIYWLVSNWVETGDPLYSIHGTYHWSHEIMGINEELDLENYLRRIWFFPFSWIIAIGIPTGYLILKTIIISYSKKDYRSILLSLPFIIMFLFYEYNTFQGSLLLQHRYIGTLVVLSLPFLAPFFSDITHKKLNLVWLFCFLNIGLSYVYNTSHVKPLPRFEEQSVVHMLNCVKANTTNNTSLIIDFIGWDKSYFIALQSKVKRNDLVVIEGAKYSTIPSDKVNAKFSNYSEGIVLLKKESDLKHVLFLEKRNITSKNIYEDDEVTILKWRKN